ncbi:Crp/Fnr family transcriptional regulator [Pedobacter antarcticus]|uniref:Crp/Fnr family transcriptional regulator n=1 Tax=Pedobacter antarcticus TaxID=34086 RepID=UPI00088913CE|nr:Crp/Fnr family transcriptional regulator [Pedobacter antarcticus]SDM27019.1 cAMP-binding domain of CRP or a regulatory subunit of cAMP-dependent protein kinases [Pedobacter antarcticus]
MLRTNHSFLSFTEELYNNPAHKEAISLKHYAKGDLLLKQDGRSTQVFIVKEGIAKCFFTEENAKEYIVEFLSEGEIIGEIEVIKNNNCLCSVEAITPLAAYTIKYPFFKHLMETNLCLNRLLLEEMAQRIIYTSTRASTQQLYTIEFGLKKILELQARQGLTLSKDDLAAYMGVTIRSLNRALKNINTECPE